MQGPQVSDVFARSLAVFVTFFYYSIALQSKKTVVSKTHRKFDMKLLKY